MVILQFPGDKQNDIKDLNVQAMEQVEAVRGQNQDGAEKQENLRVSGIKDYSNGDGHSKRGNKVIDLNM